MVNPVGPIALTKLYVVAKLPSLPCGSFRSNFACIFIFLRILHIVGYCYTYSRC
jgi:hypothetical protein